MKLCECGCGNPTVTAKHSDRNYRKGEARRFIRGHNPYSAGRADHPTNGIDEARSARFAFTKQQTIDRVLMLCGIGEVSFERIQAVTGLKRFMAKELIHKATMLPWVLITITNTGYKFVIDCDLKEFCDLYQPGSINTFSLVDHLTNLRREISRIRIANKCERTRLRWSGDAMVALELAKLLNFVEEELDRVPTITTRVSRRKAVEAPNRGINASEEDSINDQQEERSDSAIDAGTRGTVGSNVTNAGGTGVEG